MTSPQRLVSVLVPAYNRETTIGATLSGILGQTYENVEAVVVDDGSCDRTLDIARAYDPERVRVFEQPNAGCGPARNTAFRHARGDIIATCDSDDVLLPNHIELALKALDEARVPRPVVSCTAYLVSEKGLDPRRTTAHIRPPALADQRLAMLQVNWGSYLMLGTRTFFEEMNAYHPTMRSAEDWHLWLRALYGGWNIVKQTTPTALYAISADALSRDRATMTASENAVITEIYELYRDRMSVREREYVEKRLTHGSPMEMVSQADIALRAGQREHGAELLRQAAELNPREPRLAVKAKIASVPAIGPRLLEWQARRG